MADAILIWGAGAIGGTLGAAFARAGHDVLLVDTAADHVEAMNRDGLFIEGPVETFRQSVRATLPETVSGRYRRIVLAVKAHHTEDAARRLAPHLADDGFVLSAQNGLNEIALARILGETRVMGCFVNYGADYLAPGRILRGNRAAVVVGEIDGTVRDRTREMHALLQQFEPDAVLTTEIWSYLWGKLGYGALLFGTALTDETIADALASPRHRPVWQALGGEVMAVADAKGVTPAASMASIPTPSVPARTRRRSPPRSTPWSPSTAAPRKAIPGSGATSPCASARRKSTRRSALSRRSAMRPACRRRRSTGSWR